MEGVVDRIRRLIKRHTKTPLRPKVFVSYAHEDEQAVSGLASDLTDHGIDVWFAPDVLRAGDRLNPEIKRGIESAQFFLPVVTTSSVNSAWVAKEIEFALSREAKGLTVIPLYLGSQPPPVFLTDHKGIDIRNNVYKAGLAELIDRLYGRLPAGRTPLGEFERFVDSLPVIDEKLQTAIDSMRHERYFLFSWGSAEGSDIVRKNAEEALRSKLDQVKKLLETVHRGEVAARDRERILSALEQGHIPPALLERELHEIRVWLRLGRQETLAVAAQLYANRYVSRPGTMRILKSMIVHQIEGWISRGELPVDDAPTPEWLIDKLVEEQLIQPFCRNEYIREPDEKFQEFHDGRRLQSVGKAGYLFAREHPDRPHEYYPIGCLPGTVHKSSE